MALTVRGFYQQLNSFNQPRQRRQAPPLAQGSMFQAMQVYAEMNRQAGIARNNARRLQRDQAQGLAQAAAEAEQSDRARQEASRHRQAEAQRREAQAQAQRETLRLQDKLEDLEFEDTAVQGKASQLRRKIENETARLDRRLSELRQYKERHAFIETGGNTPPDYHEEHPALMSKIEKVKKSILEQEKIISSHQAALNKTQEEILRLQLETKATKVRLAEANGTQQEDQAAAAPPDADSGVNGTN